MILLLMGTIRDFTSIFIVLYRRDNNMKATIDSQTKRGVNTTEHNIHLKSHKKNYMIFYNWSPGTAYLGMKNGEMNEW